MVMVMLVVAAAADDHDHDNDNDDNDDTDDDGDEENDEEEEKVEWPQSNGRRYASMHLATHDIQSMSILVINTISFLMFVICMIYPKICKKHCYIF